MKTEQAVIQLNIYQKKSLGAETKTERKDPCSNPGPTAATYLASLENNSENMSKTVQTVELEPVTVIALKMHCPIMEEQRRFRDRDETSIF